MVIVIIENIMAKGAKGIFDSIMLMEGTGALGIVEIVLPIGISFFTFQAMSYVIDVYRGEVDPQENVIDFALYVALFPQLIAGPIVRYSTIEAEILNIKSLSPLNMH